MVCGRIDGVRESLLPRIDSIGTVELYPPEKVFSGARDPRLGNEATLLEGFSFSAQEVDNEVGDFWW